MANGGRLGLFDSIPAMNLGMRGPGTYATNFLTEGNSLISTLFIQTIDPGATIKVNWWDSGVGTNDGERFNLQGHPLVTGPGSGFIPFSDRQVVSRIHNKPNLEAIVSGGNVTFGVYMTVVSSFASDAGASLVGESQTADFSQDRGTPPAIYDPVAGKYYFAQGTAGIQTVAVQGSITANPFNITGFFTGTAPLLAYGSTATLFVGTAPGQLFVPEIVGGGDSYGEFHLYYNGTLWGIKRNSWQQREIVFSFGTKVLSLGDTVQLDVVNTSISGNAANYEGFAYYGT